jgi:signal transduction histidine kinase/CheY-like chemotaxis protein
VTLPSGEKIHGAEGIRRVMGGAEVTGTAEWGGRQYVVRLLPRRDVTGARAGATGVALDVTDQKRLEAQFLHAQKMEAVGRLAGGIAHDFNNLLTVILGSAEMLRADLPDGAAADTLDSIDTAAGQAARLTRQLLTFSRQQVLQPERLDVSVLVHGLEDMVRRLVGEDVDVEVRLAPDLPAVQLDRSQFEQVLLNLVVNARDAMPHGGSLRIETGYVARDASIGDDRCRCDAGCISLRVSDTGCGMPPEIVEHIFEPFFTTKGDAGTGLGLSTTYGIVKQSGGHLSVDSIVGRGTTFTIWLPTVEGRVTAVASAGHDRASNGRGRVLLVEDDASVSALMALALGRAGFEPLVASNGHDALRILDADAAAIDLVLTDVVMPECDGRTLGLEIGRRFPRVPVVYMSGYADQRTAPDDPDWAERVRFLQKPFSPGRLVETVRQGLGR